MFDATDSLLLHIDAIPNVYFIKTQSLVLHILDSLPGDRVLLALMLLQFLKYLIDKVLPVLDILAHEVIYGYLDALSVPLVPLPRLHKHLPQDNPHPEVIHQVVVEAAATYLGRSGHIGQLVPLLVGLGQAGVRGEGVAGLAVGEVGQAQVAHEVHLQVLAAHGPVDQVVHAVQGVHAPDQLLHVVQALDLVQFLPQVLAEAASGAI